jgi:ribosomal protein S18 acetylase RimI-like enzyme
MISLRHTIILGKNYLWFYFDEQFCGKLIFKLEGTMATIENIAIDNKFQNKHIFSLYWPLVKDHMVKKNITQINLIAKEDMNRWGKLVKLYQDIGFVKYGTISTKSFGDNSFRMIPMKYLI